MRHPQAVKDFVVQELVAGSSIEAFAISVCAERAWFDLSPPDQDIGSVIADGAYTTLKYHEEIASRYAHSVIPPHISA